MRRRTFIAGLGSAAVWPVVVRAQQSQIRRQIAVLGTYNSEGNEAFVEALAEAGWIDGRNIAIDRRLGMGDDERVRGDAAEIIGKSPEVIVSGGTQNTAILKQQTAVIPIVFVNVADPVVSGFVANFAQPGGNITGFTSLDYSLAGKWLGILKQIVPGTTDAMVLYDPRNSNWLGFMRTLELAAHSLGLTIHATSVTEVTAIEPTIQAFAKPGAGLIVFPSQFTIINRELIAELASRYRLPAIYAYRRFASAGGLVSYGADDNDVPIRWCRDLSLAWRDRAAI